MKHSLKLIQFELLKANGAEQLMDDMEKWLHLNDHLYDHPTTNMTTTTKTMGMDERASVEKSRMNVNQRQQQQERLKLEILPRMKRLIEKELEMEQSWLGSIYLLLRNYGILIMMWVVLSLVVIPVVGMMCCCMTVKRFKRPIQKKKMQ